MFAISGYRLTEACSASSGQTVRERHRFDPARLRSSVATGRTGWMVRVNAALKPIARILPPFGRLLFLPPSLLTSATTDARMTLTAYPIMLPLALGLAVAVVATPANDFMRGVVPMAFGMACIAIADMPCREHRAGLLGLIHSVPLLKTGFVWWKLLASTLVAMVFLITPLARVVVSHPASAVAFGIGLFVVVAVGTALGVITQTPKTFTLVFVHHRAAKNAEFPQSFITPSPKLGVLGGSAVKR
ncbi:MAG TPA: hypothetical protein VGK99_24485 [Acidobacteriota bacterium]